MQAKTSWKEGLKTAWKRLRGGELTPRRAALSVAVGLAIGVTPLWGTHVFLVLLVCVPLRLDVAVAYLASNISLPFIAPFLTFAEIELGARALNGAWLPITSREAMAAHGVTPFLKEIAVGTLIFSPAMATFGGGLTFAIARWRSPKTEMTFLDVFERVAERYARGRKGTRIYVRSKMTHDPVMRAVLSLGELGEVDDVGCGRGQLALALLESGHATRVHGLDWDEEKTGEATRAAEGLPATFATGDLREHAIPACDTALLVDVVHYFTSDEQDALLARVAQAARRSVVIRDLDPDRGWRSALTRLQEAITTSVRFNRGARVHVRPIASATRILEAHGFAVTVEPCWQGTPFANVLVLAHRSREKSTNSAGPTLSSS
jgi:uncharacterized protein (DUF2062 family)/2-polyprenyl-3-methyl-5-hydroxy-6-metoxy-1,4-benzoquinol methylase